MVTKQKGVAASPVEWQEATDLRISFPLNPAQRAGNLRHR